MIRNVYYSFALNSTRMRSYQYLSQKTHPTYRTPQQTIAQAKKFGLVYTVLRMRVIPRNQCTFEYFQSTFAVILRSTCAHITLGIVSQPVLDK